MNRIINIFMSLVVAMSSLPSFAESNEQPLRYLSLHGGGVLGLSQLMMLERIEQAAKKPISQLVDGVIGSSIGSIIGASLCTPGEDGQPLNSAAELKQKFAPNAREIFSLSAIGTFTADDNFEAILKREFGNAYMSRSLCHFLVTSYYVPEKRVKIFDSLGKNDLPVWQAVRASASLDIPAIGGLLGPGVVQYNGSEPLPNWRDAGLVGYNDPTQFLARALTERFPGRKIIIYSLGTGATSGSWGEQYAAFTGRYSSFSNIEVVHMEPDFSRFAVTTGLSQLVTTLAAAVGIHQVAPLLAGTSRSVSKRQAAVGLLLLAAKGMEFLTNGLANSPRIGNVIWNMFAADPTEGNLAEIQKRTEKIFATSEYARMFRDLTGQMASRYANKS